MSTAPILLGPADIRTLLPMDHCIEVVADCLVAGARGELRAVPRVVVGRDGSGGGVAVMASSRGDPPTSYGVKLIAFVPANGQRGLPTHHGVVALLDGATGAVRALMDAAVITALRTAAVSAVATRELARRDAADLAVLGSGVQARAHVEAVALVRELRQVRIWSRTEEHARSMAEELAARSAFRIEVCPTAEAAVRNASIVVTATSSPTPIVQRAWLAPGVHVNVVGGALGGPGEIELSALAAASLFVDDVTTALARDTELGAALLRGELQATHVRAELGAVLAGEATGRASSEEITLFRSFGHPSTDLAVAEHLFAQAQARTVGRAAWPS